MPSTTLQNLLKPSQKSNSKVEVNLEWNVLKGHEWDGQMFIGVHTRIFINPN